MKILYLVLLLFHLQMGLAAETNEVEFLSCKRNVLCTLQEIEIYNECIVDVYKDKIDPTTGELDPTSPWDYQDNEFDETGDVPEETLELLYIEIPYIKCKTDKINNKICFEEFIFEKPTRDSTTGKYDYA